MKSFKRGIYRGFIIMQRGETTVIEKAGYTDIEVAVGCDEQEFITPLSLCRSVIDRLMSGEKLEKDQKIQYTVTDVDTREMEHTLHKMEEE